MPKVTKHPRLRSHVRRNKSGKVKVYYFYDMRPEGKPDVPLGTDYAEALEKWEELHEKKPRAKGRLQEAIDRWREIELPKYENKETRRNYGRQLAMVETGVVHLDGSLHGITEPMAFLQGTGAMQTFKVGKKAAGRLLDGREWNEVPA